MINADMRFYDYYVYEDNNDYGQPQLSDLKGQIKMSIYESSHVIQDNINYTRCNCTGLTMADVTDKYVFQVGSDKFKVLHVQPAGRYKQVFLGRL